MRRQEAADLHPVPTAREAARDDLTRPGARAVIPPEKRARVRSGPEFGGRNAAVLRGREVGRDGWKKEAGYHRRSLAETAMMRIKTIFSDRLKSREWRRQETELRVRRAAMNRVTSLGMPQSYAI